MYFIKTSLTIIHEETIYVHNIKNEVSILYPFILPFCFFKKNKQTLKQQNDQVSRYCWVCGGTHREETGGSGVSFTKRGQGQPDLHKTLKRVGGGQSRGVDSSVGRVYNKSMRA